MLPVRCVSAPAPTAPQQQRRKAGQHALLAPPAHPTSLLRSAEKLQANTLEGTTLPRHACECEAAARRSPLSGVEGGGVTEDDEALLLDEDARLPGNAFPHGPQRGRSIHVHGHHLPRQRLHLAQHCCCQPQIVRGW